MKRTAILIALSLSFVLDLAAAEPPDWEEIDRRPTPQWWTDAKFGIFIHWGPYSVPAYSRVGDYSEWYWMDLVNPKRRGHEAVKGFHDANYGTGFTYPDFVPSFTCELFDPEQWARVFEESGAKYVVLTSKHHDGYCLWPNQESDRSWGRPWSSTSCGPERDLLGELTDAVRKTEVKMGIYYSLYEWFNPLYQADVDLFVEKHMIPQFKDVVNRYAPSVIFSDGEWDHEYTTWKSTELLKWLYTESPCKDDVVVNDRWGKNARHNHGGYYTTEYGSGMPNADNPWEENRGMAHSFGYSRTENLEDYNTSQEFVYMLIDIVSRGGNFLLDIGPTADGRIPVIMQARLQDIGDWLQVNGEAIYGTQPYERTCQWTEGTKAEEKRGRYKIKYDVLKLTVEPDPGFATKEIFFTEKENALYCICPVFPEETLTVRSLRLGTSAKISMLGVDGDLQWRQNDDNIDIVMPKVNPSRIPCRFAWTFRIDR